MAYMKNTLRQPKLKTLTSVEEFFIKVIKIFFFPVILFKLTSGIFFFCNYFPV